MVPLIEYEEMCPRCKKAYKLGWDIYRLIIAETSSIALYTNTEIITNHRAFPLPDEPHFIAYEHTIKTFIKDVADYLNYMTIRTIVYDRPHRLEMCNRRVLEVHIPMRLDVDTIIVDHNTSLRGRLMIAFTQLGGQGYTTTDISNADGLNYVKIMNWMMSNTERPEPPANGYERLSTLPNRTATRIDLPPLILPTTSRRRHATHHAQAQEGNRYQQDDRR